MFLIMNHTLRQYVFKIDIRHFLLITMKHVMKVLTKNMFKPVISRYLNHPGFMQSEKVMNLQFN